MPNLFALMKSSGKKSVAFNEPQQKETPDRPFQNENSRALIRHRHSCVRSDPLQQPAPGSIQGIAEDPEANAEGQSQLEGDNPGRAPVVGPRRLPTASGWGAVVYDGGVGTEMGVVEGRARAVEE